MSFSITERLPPYTRLPASTPPPNYDYAEALRAINALTPAERESLSNGIAVAASSKEGAEEFKVASRSAAIAAGSIETLFVTLTSKIGSLQGTEELLKDFVSIKEDFRGVVRESRDVAVKTAQYATSFDEVVIKFTGDETISVEDRIKRISTYIDDSVAIKKSAQELEIDFSKFTRRYADFVSTFSSWAKDREAAEEEKIKEIYQEIERLDGIIASIDAAMAAIGAIVGGTIGVAGLAIAAFPLLAPAILLWGGILAGLEITTIVGLAIAKNSLVNQRRNNEQKIVALQDTISKIQAARTQLEQDGQTSLMAFTDNVAAIQGIWTKVAADAQTIKIWLQEGADNASRPEYMRVSLMEGVKVYRAMGDYLKDYADGVTGLTR